MVPSRSDWRTEHWQKARWKIQEVTARIRGEQGIGTSALGHAVRALAIRSSERCSQALVITKPVSRRGAGGSDGWTDRHAVPVAMVRQRMRQRVPRISREHGWSQELKRPSSRRWSSSHVSSILTCTVQITSTVGVSYKIADTVPADEIQWRHIHGPCRYRMNEV